MGTTKTRHRYVVLKPGVCGGKPIIHGTRISVWAIASWHNRGMNPKSILEVYPSLSLAQIHDALSYYYDHQTEIDPDIAANNPAEHDLHQRQSQWQGQSSSQTKTSTKALPPPCDNAVSIASRPTKPPVKGIPIGNNSNGLRSKAARS